MKLTTLPSGQDNYSYLLQSDDGLTAVVDPGDADVVKHALIKEGRTLTHILVTHDHADHVNGVVPLKHATGATVYGPADARVPGQDRPLADGNELALGDSVVRAIATPGHTLADLSYLWIRAGAPDALFSGDTLFVSGCGRCLSGRMEWLWSSIQTLRSLEASVEVYCGHEYTLENLRFARIVHPCSEIISQREKDMLSRLERGMFSVPSTIGQEQSANPFFLCETFDQFADLRHRKDIF